MKLNDSRKNCMKFNRVKCNLTLKMRGSKLALNSESCTFTVLNAVLIGS